MSVSLKLDDGKKLIYPGVDQSIQDKHPINVIPVDLVIEIFSKLNLHDLKTICLVCKKWKDLAPWKICIFKNIALVDNCWDPLFTYEDDFKKVAKEEFSKQAYLSLSLPIIEKYKYCKRKFREEQFKFKVMLLTLPKTSDGQVSIKNLGDAIKKYKECFNIEFIYDSVNNPEDKLQPVWIVMNKDAYDLICYGFTNINQLFHHSRRTVKTDYE